MKVDCLGGGSIETIDLLKMREGRFNLKVTFFDATTCDPPVARAILEAPQLTQLAKAALELLGEDSLAAQLPTFQTGWNQKGGVSDDEETDIF